MADISIINKDNTNYNVKDAAGRLALAEVENKGAKNLFDMSGAQTFDVTGYGVHCTINKLTGVITLDGVNQDKKCTGSFNIKIADSTALGLQSGVVYKLTCDGYATSDTTIGIYVYTSGATPETQFDTYSHTELAWDTAWEQSNGFRLFIRSGTVVNNITLRPMLCTKAEWDISNAFVPYGKTNADLTLLEKQDRAGLATAIDKGAKNLFDIQHPSTVRSTSYNATADGGVELTCSNAAWTRYIITDIPVESGREYAFTLYVDEISGTNTFRAYIRDNDSTGNVLFDSNNISTVKTINATITSDSGKIWVGIYINNSATAKTASAKIRAMLCTKAEWDISNAFVPYGKTNADLTLLEKQDRAGLATAIDKGAKNLLKLGFTHKSAGTQTADMTADGNGIIVNGDRNATTDTVLVYDLVTNKSNMLDTRYTLPAGKYVIPSTGTANLRYQVYCHDGTNYKSLGYTMSNPLEFEYTSALKVQYPYIAYRLWASRVSSFDNLTVYPMICTKAEWDISQTFQPHRPSYQELSDDVDSLKNGSFVGIELKSGDDLNNLSRGRYYCRSATVSAGILNNPNTGSGFVLDHMYNVGNVVQLLYPSSSSNTIFYKRSYASSSWRPWCKFEGTEVT